MTISSYSKLLNVSHKFAAGLRNHGPHLVYQEKVDGSQFSFRVNADGSIECRSRRVPIDPEDPGMFAKAIESVRERAGRCVPGWTYRGEYLQKEKHNALKYGRVPVGHIVIFDVDRGDQDYITDAEELRAAAEAIGLEVVPTWRHSGPPDASWLERESFLGGGAIVEGYAIKDYAVIGADGKIAMAKMVRQSFREVHAASWKKQNPGISDVVDQIIEGHRTEARWLKAVQHLGESGQLVNAPQDIGPLIKEVFSDVEAECEQSIKDLLWAHYRKRILKGCTRGLPEWYRARLAE